MLNKLRKADWATKVLVGVSVFLLVCAGLNFVIRDYFTGTIDNNWEKISSEKEANVKDECKKLFDAEQKSTIDFADQLLQNKKILNSFASQNPKKLYESFYELANYSNFNSEIYNSRLDPLLFSGRQIYPEITELQRSLNGEKFTTVKENGFYTYLIAFEPIITEIDSLNPVPGKPSGVVVTAKLIDANYKMKNIYFKNYGFTKDIENKFDLKVSLITKTSNNKVIQDTEDSTAFQQLLLKGINGEVIATLIIPHLDKIAYLDYVKDNFQKFFSVLMIFLNIVLVLFVLKIIKSSDTAYLQVSVITILLILSRLFWLFLEFPSNILKNISGEIFSPAHYASSFAFGIGKSLGELLITSVFTLLVSSIILSSLLKSVKKSNEVKINAIHIISSIIFILAFIIILQCYGLIIQSLVYDSNIKYFDRSQIIPFNQPDLILGELIILLFSISLIIILVSCIIPVLRTLHSLLNRVKFVFSRSYFLIAASTLVINIVMFIIGFLVYEHSMSFWIRNLIIIQITFFAFYILRQVHLRKVFKINSAISYSIIALICIIFVPMVLLAKITSQENKYLELIGRKVAENEEDEINSLILTTLDDISENNTISIDITNRNKFSKLAFNIWSQSALFSENLNTGVFVLDSSKKLISDFNINPDALNSDSVYNSVIQTLDSADRKKSTSDIKIDNETDVSDEESEIPESDQLFQNKDLKFFYGIKSIEKATPGNRKFNSPLGYIVVAAKYDSKNFIGQSGNQILRNFSSDNLVNKLTSSPDISEFSNGELVSSTNKDIARTIIKSLEPFKESIADKADKTSLRYDVFENQLYKSFYLLSDRGTDNSAGEKIYVVSLKANDFNMMTYFFFKFLLLAVFIFMVILALYAVTKVFYYLAGSKAYSTFKFGFREKIFVSFILVSVIPIIVLALYSRQFVQAKNNEFYKSQIISDLNLVEQYIKHKSPPIDFSKLRQSKSTDYYGLQDIFGKGFSEFHKNFNLYIYNKLVSTTDEQLYKSDLLDYRISSGAYYNIALLKKDFYYENAEIGNLNVLAGYKPILDNYNNLLGIISSQTVFKQNEINNELTENLVYIFGVYFVAVILLIIIVNILSYTISNPIIRLQRATDQLSKGNIEIEVKSTSKDEIGDLITSFNKMTKELKRSREELKKAERESAWRDIARQVAHEIKNPLTPMKLAMQHLYYAYSHGSKDFKSILHTTNVLIIDQIETLNRIATEFSDFAKMPQRNYEPLDINSVLCDVVNLLNTDNKISINIQNDHETAIVIGDKDEIKRALINIIRNSIQAIDEKVINRKDGHITISTFKTEFLYTILVKDNGIGMDEQTLQKLFEPYFSTKSSGMGLGLVITKKIIDDMNGNIYVRSEINNGTVVEIVLKLKNDI